MVQTTQRGPQSPFAHKAVVPNPTLVYARNLYQKKQYDAALVAISGSRARDWEAQKLLGQIYEKQNKKSEALRSYHNSLLESRGNPDVMLCIARALLKNSPTSSEINEAATFSNKVAMYAAPDDIKAHRKVFTLNCAAMSLQGKLGDALSLLESHLKGNPLIVEYHKQIVSLLARAKDYGRIISHYEEYKKLFKDSEPKWWISFDEVWQTIGLDNKGQFGKSLFDWLDMCLETVDQILASSKNLKWDFAETQRYVERMSELLEFVVKTTRTMDSPQKDAFINNNYVDYKGRLDFCKGLSEYKYILASSQDRPDSTQFLNSVKSVIGSMKQSLHCIRMCNYILINSFSLSTIDCADQKSRSLPRLSSTCSELICILEELKLDSTDLESDLRNFDEDYVEECFSDLNIVTRRCCWYISRIQYASFVCDQVLKMFRLLQKVTNRNPKAWNTPNGLFSLSDIVIFLVLICVENPTMTRCDELYSRMWASLLYHYRVQEASIAYEDTNPTLSALHSLARRYGSLDINDQSTPPSTPTKQKISRDALDIPLPSTPTTPQSDARVPIADTPTLPSITPPDHLMSIQSIIRQIGELERDAVRNTGSVELITAVLESMLQDVKAPELACLQFVLQRIHKCHAEHIQSKVAGFAAPISSLRSPEAPQMWQSRGIEALNTGDFEKAFLCFSKIQAPYDRWYYTATTFVEWSKVCPPEESFTLQVIAMIKNSLLRPELAERREMLSALRAILEYIFENYAESARSVVASDGSPLS